MRWKQTYTHSIWKQIPKACCLCPGSDFCPCSSLLVGVCVYSCLSKSKSPAVYSFLCCFISVVSVSVSICSVFAVDGPKASRLFRRSGAGISAVRHDRNRHQRLEEKHGLQVSWLEEKPRLLVSWFEENADHRLADWRRNTDYSSVDRRKSPD